MDETERMRGYIEDRIAAHKSTLNHYLEQKTQAEIKIEDLTKTLELLDGMLEYMRQAEGGKAGQLPLVEEEMLGERPYAQMSIVDGVFEVLNRAGRPLHVTKIWAELQRGGKTLAAKRPTLSITGALLRDEHFENLGKNTFRVKEVPNDADKKS